MIAEFWATEGVGGDGNTCLRLGSEWFQLTYGELREAPHGDSVARFSNGAWITEDGRVWSDVILTDGKADD